MLKTILASFIFLSIVACTGGGGPGAGGRGNINIEPGGPASPGRPSGGTEGVPGYFVNRNKIRATYTGNLITVGAPAGVVASDSKAMRDLRVTVLTAPVASLNALNSASAGSTVSILGSVTLGTVTPNSDGSFTGEFPRPTQDKEILAVVIGSVATGSGVTISSNVGVSTAVTQFIPSTDGEVAFAALSSELGPRVAVQSTAGSVSQSGDGENWINPIFAGSPGGGIANVRMFDGRSTSSLRLTNYFSSLDKNIPLSSNINGFGLNCAWRKTDPTGKAIVSSLKLVKNNVAHSNNLGNQVTGFRLPDSMSLSGGFGETADSWGRRLTASDVNAADFGFEFQLYEDSGTGVEFQAQLDYCEIKIYYTVVEVSAFALTGPSVQLNFLNLWDSISDLKLERRAKGGQWAEIATLPSSTVTYTDTGVTSLTEYEYRNRGFDTSGESMITSSATVVTQWQGGLFSDGFNSGVNSLFWTNNGGFASVLSGKLHLSFPSVLPGVPAVWGGLVSKFLVTGNFDARVDYSDISFSCNWTNVGLYTWIDDNNGYSVHRSHNSVVVGVNATLPAESPGMDGDAIEPTGILRIKRVGNAYTAYRQDGATVLYTWTGSTGPVTIGLHGGNSGPCINSGRLDNFLLQ